MKTIIHDLGKEQNDRLLAAADRVVCADGRYAPCQGCSSSPPGYSERPKT